jgi:hypothetical protein
MDLSAGLVPAQQPSPAPLDLSAGLVPAQQPGAPTPSASDPGLWDRVKQGAKATMDAYLDPIKGVGEDVAEDVGGVDSIVHNVGEKIHSGLGEALAPQASINKMQELATPSDGSQQLYKGVAGVAEFMLGDEALKGASMTDKLAKIAPMVQKLEKSPALLHIAEQTIAKAQKASSVIAAHPNAANIAGTAFRQAVVGGGQAAIKGDDADEVGLEAGIGAAGGAVGEGLAGVYNAVKPGVTEIAGVAMPKLASQARGVARKIIGADIGEAPKIAAAQQAGSQQVIENVAQRATRKALEDINTTRMPIGVVQNPARALAAPGDMRPYTFDLQTGPAGMDIPESDRMLYRGQTQQIGAQQWTQGSDGVYQPNPSMRVPYSEEEPGTYQGLTGIDPSDQPAELEQPTVRGGGVLQTDDPAIAQQHLTALNEASDGSDDADLLGARDRLQQQLDFYHAAQNAGPKFAPIDTQRAASMVNSFKDASDQIQASAQPVYKKLDEVSGGEFQKWRNQQKAAANDIKRPGSVDAQNAASDRYSEATGHIDQIFKSFAGRANVSPEDYNAAQKAWTASKVLDQVHATVEGMFNGVPKSVSDSIASKYGPGEVQRQITRASTTRLGNLVNRVGLGKLNDVLGQDGVENLYRMADLMSDAKTATRTSELAKHVGRVAGLHGLHAGMGFALGYGGADIAGADSETRWRAAALGAATQGIGSLALRQMAINPHFGQLMDYAARNNVNPKLSIPLLTGALTQGVQAVR